MRKWEQWSMAATLVILLTGVSAFGQSASFSPVSPRDPVQQVAGQAPPVVLVPPGGAPDCAPSGPPCVPDVCWGGDQACQGYGRFWVTTEALLWWMKGQQLPPLVTTSPAGTPQNQAGVLGADGTSVLFGNSTVNNSVQGGFRINTGVWLDCNRRWGIEGDFFMLSSQATNFSAASNGDPILARPFFDVTTNQNSSELVAFPGVVNGSISASAVTTGLIGAGALFRANLCCSSCFRLDWLGGYRYLTFSDRLSIDESLTDTSASNSVVPGSTLAVGDRFATRNTFNGFNTGLSAQYQRGAWALEGLATVAVGDNHRTVDIDGSTTVTVPGMPSVTNTGGFLALPSNIGHFSSDNVAVIPQFGANLYYQITPWLRATLGYTFLLWPHVARSGDVIDTAVNPNLLPPANPLAGGPAHPAFTGGTSTFWAQGISAGLQLRF